MFFSCPLKNCRNLYKFVQAKSFSCFGLDGSSVRCKETALEIADFNLLLLMFVNAVKEIEMFIISFLSIILSAVVPLVSSKDSLKLWPTGLEVSSF